MVGIGEAREDNEPRDQNRENARDDSNDDGVCPELSLDYFK